MVYRLSFDAIALLSIQVRVRLLADTCFEALPTTDTKVAAPVKEPEQCMADAAKLIECLRLDSHNVGSVDVRSVVFEVRFKRQESC